VLDSRERAAVFTRPIIAAYHFPYMLVTQGKEPCQFRNRWLANVMRTVFPGKGITSLKLPLAGLMVSAA